METLIDNLWNKAIIGLAEIDSTGKFMKANPAFCDLVGYNEAELQDRSWQDITHPDDVDGGKEMTQRVLNKEVPGYTMEKRYITKRGNVIWITAYISPVTHEDGTIKILLKQVVSVPILVPAQKNEQIPPAKPAIKDNIKIIIAAAFGFAMVITGALIKDPEIQNLGVALTVGVFGGFLNRK